MAILSAMQSAAVKLLGQRPGSFFGSSGTFEMEITDLVNEVARDVAKYQDWQALIRFATITGDGFTAEFDLPGDYDRMTQASRVQETTAWAWGFYHANDLNEFTWLVNAHWGIYPGVWTIYDNKMRFQPAPVGTIPATYPYISANFAIDAGTQAGKSEFTSDTDTFLLPERLLTLGLVWRWRENKKLDASGDQEAFVKALDEYAAKDRGARVYRRNSRVAFPGTHLAWPWALGGLS